MSTSLKDEDGVELHCVSCHEDHDEGYFGYNELWDYDGVPEGEDPPPEKRYCCCCQMKLAGQGWQG